VQPVKGAVGDLVMLQKVCRRGTYDPNNMAVKETKTLASVGRGQRKDSPMHAFLLFALFNIYIFLDDYSSMWTKMVWSSSQIVPLSLSECRKWLLGDCLKISK